MSDGSLKKIAPQPMGQKRLVVLILDPPRSRLLHKQASRAKLRINRVRIKLMRDLNHVLDDKAERGDVGGDFFRHFSSPVLCDSSTVEVHGGRAIPPCSPAVATPSVIETGLEHVRPGHTPEAVRDLRFRLIGQGFAASRSIQPFIGADAGHRERLPARHPRHEVHKNHIAARRGLSLSVHAPTVKRGWSSVIETFNGNLLGT